jgi:hypothetical protein
MHLHAVWELATVFEVLLEARRPELSGVSEIYI